MEQFENRQIENHSNQIDEDLLFNVTSDEAVERAAGIWPTGAFTMGNCTGLGSCPA